MKMDGQKLCRARRFLDSLMESTRKSKSQASSEVRAVMYTSDGQFGRCFSGSQWINLAERGIIKHKIVYTIDYRLFIWYREGVEPYPHIENT